MRSPLLSLARLTCLCVLNLLSCQCSQGLTALVLLGALTTCPIFPNGTPSASAVVHSSPVVFDDTRNIPLS